jgi:hypothetical protein
MSSSSSSVRVLGSHDSLGGGGMSPWAAVDGEEGVEELLAIPWLDADERSEGSEREEGESF